MKTGKIIKKIFIPDPNEKNTKTTSGKKRREEEAPIYVPNWPVKIPVKKS